MSTHAEDRQDDTETMHAASREIKHLMEVKAVMLEAMEAARKFLVRTHEYQGGFMEAEDAVNSLDHAIKLANGESQ
jgi:2-phosphoglycerate kinase